MTDNFDDEMEPTDALTLAHRAATAQSSSATYLRMVDAARRQRHPIAAALAFLAVSDLSARDVLVMGHKILAEVDLDLLAAQFFAGDIEEVLAALDARIPTRRKS